MADSDSFTSARGCSWRTQWLHLLRVDTFGCPPAWILLVAMAPEHTQHCPRTCSGLGRPQVAVRRAIRAAAAHEVACTLAVAARSFTHGSYLMDMGARCMEEWMLVLFVWWMDAPWVEVTLTVELATRAAITRPRTSIAPPLLATSGEMTLGLTVGSCTCLMPCTCPFMIPQGLIRDYARPWGRALVTPGARLLASWTLA